MHLIQAFWTDESGQGLTEYAAIIALVSIGLMLVLIAFRNELGRIFNAITAELRSQTGSINQYPAGP
jgi:Flp pilus assembly pilin Flp